VQIGAGVVEVVHGKWEGGLKTTGAREASSHFSAPNPATKM
jgi:hypothetical protein